MILLSAVLAFSSGATADPPASDELCSVSLDQGMYNLQSIEYKSGGIRIRKIGAFKEEPSRRGDHQPVRAYTNGADLAVWVWDRGYFYRKVRSVWKSCGHMEAKDKTWSTRKGWQRPHEFWYQDTTVGMKLWPSAKDFHGYLAARCGPIFVFADPVGISYDYKTFLTQQRVAGGKKFADVSIRAATR